MSFAANETHYTHANPPPLPKVTCFALLDGTKVDGRQDTVTVTTKEQTYKYGNFLLIPSLTLNCGTDGASDMCWGYSLKVILKNKNSESFSGMNKISELGTYKEGRINTSLKVGEERAFVNCDFGPPTK